MTNSAAPRKAIPELRSISPNTINPSPRVTRAAASPHSSAGASNTAGVGR